MDAGLLEVRNVTYRRFVELGRAPSAEEVAAATDRTTAQIKGDWRELHRAHALVLNPATDEIRMANPFSAVPTAYRVQAGGRWRYGNCAWDTLGICAALHTDGSDRDVLRGLWRGDRVEVRGQRPDDERSSSTAWCPRRIGGTTSSSPEAG